MQQKGNRVLFDIAIIGCGPSSFGFLRGLEKNPTYKGKKIAIICPKEHLDSSKLNITFKGSPKLLQPQNRLSANYYEESFGVFELKDFSFVGIHGIGGMARIWGGSFGVFSQDGLKRNGFYPNEFNEIYKDLESILPLSGNKNDEIAKFYYPLKSTEAPEISDRIKELFGVYSNLKVGYPRIMLYLDGLRACKKSNQCLAGCKQDSVWYPRLEDFSSDYLETIIVRDLALELFKMDNGYAIKTTNKMLKAKKIILAAGALFNFKLLSTFSNTKEARLFCTPAFVFAFLSFKPNTKKEFFGMGNATFIIQRERESEPILFGNFYDGYSLAISKGKVFSNNFLIDRLMRPLVARVIAGSGFSSSDNAEVVIKKMDKIIYIKASPTSVYEQTKKETKNILKEFSKWAKTPLITFKSVSFGADIHYAGAIPNDLYDKKLIKDGKLKGLDGLYAIGGSSFSYLEPMSQTLSFIANSYRIGKNLI